MLLLWGTPREMYEVASFAHILAMLYPLASTGNLGIQLVLNLLQTRLLAAKQIETRLVFIRHPISPGCTDDHIHFMLLSLAVDEASRSDFLHLLRENLDIVLIERFKEPVARLVSKGSAD